MTHVRWWPRLAILGGLLVLATSTAGLTVAQVPTTGTATPTLVAGAFASGGSAADLATAYGPESLDPHDEEDGITRNESSVIEKDGDLGLGGISNIVRLRNHQDGRLRITSNVDLNRIHGQRVTPRNVACAVATCTDCQTIALALQLNLYRRTATIVAPQNAAVALNVECARCYTVALALQYTLPVDDPNATPEDVSELIDQMDRELREIHDGPNIDRAEAEARLNDVIGRFTSLAESLNKQRQEATETTSVTATPTTTVTPTGTATPTGTVMPTDTPTPTDTPDAATGAPAGQATETPTVVPAATSAGTPVPAETATSTPATSPAPSP